MANELNLTSLDHEGIKQSLISFLKSSDEFSDFDYDGSAINTIVDLLTRDTVYMSFLANMLANESFIDSAQIRANVVSHAQKLSYTPRSATAARVVCDVSVVPSDVNNAPTSIVMEAGKVFLASIDGETYSFTNKESYLMTFSSSQGAFKALDVELFQGQLITNKFVYSHLTPIVIPNPQCDTSTLVVNVSQASDQGNTRVFTQADSLDQLSSDSGVFFLSETPDLKPKVAFGRGILGAEPNEGSIVSATYISTENNHANGVSAIVAASTISGYSNINVAVSVNSYGGHEREDIEDIRFIAPQYYQAQYRAVNANDYIPILKKQFPFIKSAFSWGGEKSNPPVYGTVFISVLSERGELVTNSVKRQMESFVKDRNVGSITPKIVDPEIFNIVLNISFSYDNRKTSKSFNDLKAKVNEVVNAYNNQINDYGKFYDDSEVIDRLKDIQGIVSVVTDKLVYKRINVLRFENPVYSYSFGNPITENSVSMVGFKTNTLGTDFKLYDRGGEVFSSYVLDGQVFETSVGTVDYQEGVVDFSINMIQEENQVDLYVEPKDDNFYVEQNRLVKIDRVTSDLLATTKRT